ANSRVAIDKPAVALWPQVLAVKLLGFTPRALLVPAAVAGTVTVPLLADAVRRVSGRAEALIAAAALSVLPVAVLTERSDTMDALMMLACVAAAWCAVRARGGRPARALAT